MHRSPTPIGNRPSRVARRGASAAAMSGMVAALCLLASLHPESAEAQSNGTLQVTAVVVPADPAWDGLSAAQGLARDLAAGSGAEARQVDLGLASVRFEPRSGKQEAGVSIQFLKN